MNTPNGPLERTPVWATYVLPNVNGQQACTIHWERPPESTHKWKNMHPNVLKFLHKYECHIRISGSKRKILLE